MTQTRKDNSMTKLYQRLANAGFNRPFVRNIVMPEWWEDEIGETPAGYSQGVGLVARHLGLDVRTLYGDAGDIAYYNLGPKRFKKSLNVSEDDLNLAVCLAMRVAELAGYATPAPVNALPVSAKELRSHLLSLNTACVDLETLVEYCWTAGIPVLHINQFPAKAKKPQGLVVRIEGRPIIVLSDNHKSPAWIAFLLAHELGHVECGHLHDGEPHIDEDIEKKATSQEEREATAYGIEVLTGIPEIKYVGGPISTAGQLAKKAISQGKAGQIDPGALVLNYGKTTADWSRAMTALKSVEGDAEAAAIIRKRMSTALDWERLPEESQQFLRRMTGATPAE